MLQLRCTLITEEMLASDDHGFILEVPDNPTQWLFTLHVCRLMMPQDTDPLHLENWHQVELLVRQLSIIYKQAQPRPPMRCLHTPGRRAQTRRRREH